MTDTIREIDHPAPTTRKRFLWGIVAGLAMMLFTFAARALVNAQSIPELAADWFTMYLPPELFDLLLENLLFSAKPLMFAGLLSAQVMVGGLLGMLYGKLLGGRPTTELGEWGRTLGFGVALWLLTMVALVPLFGGGFFGSKVVGGVIGFLLTSFGSFAIYGLVLGYFFTQSIQQGPQTTGQSDRRAFLKKAGAWAALAAVVALGLKFVSDQFGGQVGSSGAFRTRGVLSTEVTPNDEFYIVSKNFIDPEVSVDGWLLEVTGQVEAPFYMGYEQLVAMPSVEEYVTLECISNLVGGDLISNAKWKGVPLRGILERAKLKPSVVDIAFHASDGYSESVPLEMAMRDEVIVAYQMNGEPLPSKHGFPARLIVPGYFGLKHVKWLNSIEPVVTDFRGYWQQRGWTDVPHVKTFSRIDIPTHNSEIADETLMLGGVAFAGDRGISKVEVSADGGVTWTAADRVSEPLSQYTWVIWTTEIAAPQTADARIQVRATDGNGEVQTATVRGSLPDGATGHHTIRLGPVGLATPERYGPRIGDNLIAQKDDQ